MAETLSGFELLLFKTIKSKPIYWERLKTVIQEDEEDTDEGIKTCFDEIDSDDKQNLWFVSVALHKRRDFLYQLMKEEQQRILPKAGENLFSLYLNGHNFTVLHLDSIFKYGEDNTLPCEIFKCANVKVLSLKYNCLETIPADIGRLSNLTHLALTNNKLQVQALPYSLTFCRKLRTILLDNNLLDALPGFLLKLPSIRTVHRHGNHNYFKSTFMWYHTDVEYRIIPVAGTNVPPSTTPRSLQFWAAKVVIGAKLDFFNDDDVAHVLKDYVSGLYSMFRVCYHCTNACLQDKMGFKVITFKNPYLGNTCVPFQHWACSIDCAKALEVPARQEQINAARKLDRMYEEYVDECNRMFTTSSSATGLCSCIPKAPPSSDWPANPMSSRNSALITSQEPMLSRHKCVVS